jgi:hypothetical protein
MNNFLDDITNEATALKWIEQGSDEWDKVRIGRFTSSEIHRLMTEPKTKIAKEAGELSETAKTYVNEKIAEVLTTQCKPQGYAFPLVYGKETEPDAIEYFVNKTGFEWRQVGFFPFGDHAGGSPDGEVNEDQILEVKCPYDSSKQLEYLELNDQYDLKNNFKEYYWQCMANLLFTQKKACHFVTYDPRYEDDRFKMTHIVIEPKSDDLELITERIAKGVEMKLKMLNWYRTSIK